MTDKEFDLEVGDIVSFLYVERNRDYNFFPVVTHYSTTEITGIITHIRDIEEDKLDYKTIRKTPEIERSQYIVTVKKPNGLGKYYNGRMVNVRKHNTSSSVEALVTDADGKLVEDVRAILSISEKGLNITYKKAQK
jgi:hypothetical protein